MKNKHLTLSERITIQEMLERKQSFRTIARELDKSMKCIFLQTRPKIEENEVEMRRQPNDNFHI